MARIVRRLRVLEYIGPEDWINECLERRGVKGIYRVGAHCAIREALLGETNELFEDTSFDDEQARYDSVTVTGRPRNVSAEKE